MLGTDVSGPEYCTITGNVSENHSVVAPLDNAEASGIASWNMNAVRIPLNEDCWLGVNESSVSKETYQSAIENWVSVNLP